MNTYEIIKELAKSKRISIAELERKLDLSNGSISKWGKSEPNSKPLQLVADFFEVSTDYLLGRTANPNVAKTGDSNVVDKLTQQAIVMFRKETENLSESEKERFNVALAGLMKTARQLIQDDSNWK
ncbi:transcriptional regulator [Streptococcus suis]|uniref:helix-turn-helix domain-containing protein n=1 Tax=Streptococcus suis TaxID=1307 RepID=UPI0005CD8F10|nr:helix-turn-helix transcriptional regulator [Streptococcus suis]NQG06899.1 helix-turn-helix transcriptional regulator [Streptococcus suis]CYW18349.1 repressor protein [Streptococcus suis]BCK42952.1 transcriptional regulator [Streptococcus suis]HEM3538623.1 helix-turn-helix transcriptional regulator [Streptococcus suis]HEM3545216.1 helix-turn-helix transcriptional regulator [Streptococcus suis]